MPWCGFPPTNPPHHGMCVGWCGFPPTNPPHQPTPAHMYCLSTTCNAEEPLSGPLCACNAEEPLSGPLCACNMKEPLSGPLCACNAERALPLPFRVPLWLTIAWQAFGISHGDGDGRLWMLMAEQEERICMLIRMLMVEQVERMCKIIKQTSCTSLSEAGGVF